MTRKRAAETLLAAALVVGSIAPFVYLLVLSVAGAWEFPRLWPDRWRFDRWTIVVTADLELAESLFVSLLVSTTVAILATGAGYVTARTVAMHRWRTGLLLLAYLPFAASPVVLGVCLLFVYIKLGLVATGGGVVLAHTLFAYGFSVVFWTPFWNAEMRALADLVRTLGGTTRQLYRRVLLPLSTGPLWICFFQTFLISWFQYGLTILVGSGKVKTLPLKVYDYVNEANIGYAAVASVLLVLPPLILLAVNTRMVRRLG